jgi:putative DNA primase/helicase
MVTTFQAQSLPQTHQDEWVLHSGVCERITTNSIESATDNKTIAKFLEWKGYYHLLGYFIYGIDLQSGKRIIQQFKPDEPHPFPEKEPAKYLTAKSHYDAILLDAPGLDWYQVASDVTIPLHIGEGGKKAGALLTHGYTAIGLCGVDMWHLPKKKASLVPNLELIEWKGREANIIFDADSLTNDNVKRNIREVGKELSKRGARVYAVSWDLSLGKGIDDVLVKHGKQMLEYIMSTKQPYDVWLKALENQFNNNPGTEPQKLNQKLPPQDEIAWKVAEKYRDQMAWNSSIQSWFKYSPDSGMWEELTSESVRRLVSTHLQALPSGHNFTANYVSGVMMQLKAYLEVTSWDEQPGLIPLQDGVLDIVKQKLLPHAPGYRFLWQLPYKWADRTIGCEPIQAWLMEATKGNCQVIQVLRAYLKAVVTGRTDLQRYLELIGAGGTGKGTYSRLAMALIGKCNTVVTTLEQLEKNRFETAAIHGKRLLLITDSERYGGEVSTLKAITGGDPVRYEKKNVQQTKPFMPTCMVIVSANEPIQSSDYTSGLERRRLTIPFTHQVEQKKRRDLDVEFKPYLAGLLEWVLTMPDEQVAEFVRNTSESVFALKNWKVDTLLDTNPLADWFDSCLALVVGEKTYVGDSRGRTDLYLYASYCDYMAGSGNKAVSGKRFSNLLQDLAVNQLGFKTLKKARDRNGSYFPNLVIRTGKYAMLPRPITGNLDVPPDDTPPPLPPPCDGSMSDCDGLVTAETLSSDGCDGCDGFSQSDLHTEHEAEILIAEMVPLVADEVEASNPSQSITMQAGQGFQPSQQPITIHHQASLPSQQPVEVAEIAQELAPATTELEPLQVNDVVVFTNPDNLLAFKKFENLSLTIITLIPLADLAQCKLPDNTTESFKMGTLKKVAQPELAAVEKVAQPQRRFKNGDRVRYQHWHGIFGGYVRSGCLVVFDKSKSTTKFGSAPTEPLAESELVLIERANFLPKQ